MPINEDIGDFARTIHEILRSDRDVNIGVGGFTGEGKSTFSTLLQKKYSEIAGVYWGFDRMTWSRKELMKWIDGKGKEKEGQLPEYSAILPDELFAMFYRRNWYNEEQIDAISTFNMCRDRHIFLCGNIPNFWELDSGFTSRIRFYVYIPKRGTAWVFQQEVNPFSSDNWNKQENKKMFRKHKHPFKCPNFVCEVSFPDWDDQEKKAYYEIRNSKRLSAIQDNKTEKIERYSKIKKQRDIMIRLAFKLNPKFTDTEIAELTGLSRPAIGFIREGVI